MSTDVPLAIPAPRPRWPRVVGFVGAAAGLAAGIVGAMLLLKAGAGRVETIRVTKHSMLPESFVGTPDYFLKVGTRDKKEVATKVFSDTPIGNGLDFPLPEPQELEDLVYVELFDEDVARDDIRDRVEVRERICRGQDYEFEFIGPPSPRNRTGTITLAAGGAALTIAAIFLVRSYAI